jgi:hypothetical protein
MFKRSTLSQLWVLMHFSFGRKAKMLQAKNEMLQAKNDELTQVIRPLTALGLTLPQIAALLESIAPTLKVQLDAARVEASHRSEPATNASVLSP